MIYVLAYHWSQIKIPKSLPFTDNSDIIILQWKVEGAFPGNLKQAKSMPTSFTYNQVLKYGVTTQSPFHWLLLPLGKKLTLALYAQGITFWKSHVLSVFFPHIFYGNMDLDFYLVVFNSSNAQEDANNCLLQLIQDGSQKIQ